MYRCNGCGLNIIWVIHVLCCIQSLHVSDARLKSANCEVALLKSKVDRDCNKREREEALVIKGLQDDKERLTKDLQSLQQSITQVRKEKTKVMKS